MVTQANVGADGGPGRAKISARDWVAISHGWTAPDLSRVLGKDLARDVGINDARNSRQLRINDAPDHGSNPARHDGSNLRRVRRAEIFALPSHFEIVFFEGRASISYRSV